MLEQLTEGSTKWSNDIEMALISLLRKQGLYAVTGNRNVSSSSPRLRFSKPNHFLPGMKFMCYKSSSTDDLSMSLKQLRDLCYLYRKIWKPWKIPTKHFLRYGNIGRKFIGTAQKNMSLAQNVNWFNLPSVHKRLLKIYTKRMPNVKQLACILGQKTKTWRENTLESFLRKLKCRKKIVWFLFLAMNL